MMRLVLVCAAVFLVPATAGAQSLQAGKWSSTGSVTAVDMPGMPPEALAIMKQRPISHSYCLTAGEIENGARGLFSEGNGECKYSKFEMANGKLNAVMQCRGPQGNMRMTMIGTYGPSSYVSTNVMVMEGPQGNMRMTTRSAGKRTGDC